MTSQQELINKLVRLNQILINKSDKASSNLNESTMFKEDLINELYYTIDEAWRSLVYLNKHIASLEMRHMSEEC